MLVLIPLSIVYFKCALICLMLWCLVLLVFFLRCWGWCFFFVLFGMGFLFSKC